MADKDLISVIVPFYNEEKYLRRCLDSLANQDYQNYEVILVNDGSTDKSCDIAKEFQKEYDNFKVINQTNMGLSAARNTGIDHSSGMYFSFVDSDDYVTVDFLSYLMSLIKKYRCKISSCAHQNLYPNSKIIDSKTNHISLYSDKKYLNDLGFNKLPYGYGVSIHSRLFDKNLFNTIRFPNGKLFEDSATFYKLLISANSIAVGSQIKYFYCQNPGSIVHTKFSMTRMQFIDAEKMMATDVVKKYPELKDAMRQRLNYAYMNTLANEVLSGDKKFKTIEEPLRKKILQNYDFILKSKTAPKRDKIGMIVLKRSLLLYRLLFIIYKKNKKY